MDTENAPFDGWDIVVALLIAFLAALWYIRVVL